MFRRLAGSWQLVKASAAVLSTDKALIVFPIVSTIGTLIVTLSFIIPMFFAGIFTHLIAGVQSGANYGSLASAPNSSWWVFVPLAFLFYLVQYFVIFFANTALVGAAMIRLQGGKPTVGAGFGIAFARIGPIFGYALISATVGVILQFVRERAGIVGQIAAGFLGLAWNVATFLVVPILAIEQVGPIQAVKRSTELLKRTWGEQIIGNIGIGAVFGLLTFGVFILGAVGVALGIAINSIPLVVAVVVLGVFALVVLGLISAALRGIYQAAVYRYATTGQLTPGFSAELVQGAFRQKRVRGPRLW